jgi:hypothetical protein
MHLHLTCGTVLVVDDGPMEITDAGDLLFMSVGWPVVIGAGWPDRLVDADGLVAARFSYEE